MENAVDKVTEKSTTLHNYRIGDIPVEKLRIKKVRKSLDLTLWEKLYVPEICRGLSITARHFFKNLIGFVLPPEAKKRAIPTVYYPEERAVIPAAYRGKPVLVTSEKDGLEKCVACGLCELICPAKAISITANERENGERYPEIYDIDMSRCVYCGFCEEVCPKEAIVMSNFYENLAVYERKNMIYSKDKLMVSEKELTGRINYIRRIYDKCNY